MAITYNISLQELKKTKALKLSFAPNKLVKFFQPKKRKSSKDGGTVFNLCSYGDSIYGLKPS